MTISAIVAVAHDLVIGHDNQIPWYLPADLAWFKKNTIHHTIIMGRNTYHSIGRPLPKRTNIVLTRDPFFTAEGVVTAHTLADAFHLAEQTGDEEIFIIGGGQIYRDTADWWDRIYLTEVDVQVEGSVRFPEINLAEWREIFTEPHLPDEKNEHPYTFRIFERIE